VISTLLVRNHQRTCLIKPPLLHQIARDLLQRVLPHQQYDLSIHLMPRKRMVYLNETFLQHRGTTDVITFDYSEAPEPGLLQGEIFICVDEALAQARHFRTSWQCEVVRYLVHGVLHLSGYDDTRPQARREMKRAENRLLKQLTERFSLTRIGSLRARSSLSIKP